MKDLVFSKESVRHIIWGNLKWHTIRTHVCGEIRIYRRFEEVLLRGKSVTRARSAAACRDIAAVLGATSNACTFSSGLNHRGSAVISESGIGLLQTVVLTGLKDLRRE